MTAAPMSTAGEAAARQPLMESAHYDRNPELTGIEFHALGSLGVNLRRGRDHHGSAADWAAIERLVQPLDDARARLHLPAEHAGVHHRRSSLNAIGWVLLVCAQRRCSYWNWSTDEWSAILGSSQEEFTGQAKWLSSSDRQYLATYAYLLCDFTTFERLGPFDRRALTIRLFGTTADESVSRVLEVLAASGYRTAGRVGCSTRRWRGRRFCSTAARCWRI